MHNEPSTSSFQLVTTSLEASAEAQDTLWRSMVKVPPLAAAQAGAGRGEGRSVTGCPQRARPTQRAHTLN